jgi:hypothetical protein
MRDRRAVQDMLGHQDPKSTARYARAAPAQSNPALFAICSALSTLYRLSNGSLGSVHRVCARDGAHAVRSE